MEHPAPFPCVVSTIADINANDAGERVPRERYAAGKLKAVIKDAGTEVKSNALGF